MKLEHKIKQSPLIVFEYLTDMQRFVSIHPVIYKIERLKDNSYKVFETLKLAGISFSFTYKATVESIPQTKIIIKATVMKITKIEMMFNIRQDNDHTIIDEEIFFDSPLPVKPIMQKIFKEQHTVLFKNMEKAN